MESSVKKEPPKLALPMERVLSFATITAAGFVLGKLSGIFREMVVTAQFGLSSELDAYIWAGLVPTLINNVIAGSAIYVAVMPTFARYLTSGKRAEFWRAASVITNIVLLITGVITVLGMLLAGPIISILAGASPEGTQAAAAHMLVIMMPTLFLGALLNMLLAVLNSLDRFTAPALIFLALNLGMIATIVLLSPHIGIYAVAWGFLIGVGLQVILQFVELRRENPRYGWRIDWHHPALRPVFLAFLPITALAMTAQINPVIDKSMAAVLPEGSVGALNYADVVLGAFYMLGYSLGIAVFPNLSRMAAANDLESTARSVTTSLRILIFLLAPLTFILIGFATPAVGLILGRGRFDAGDVQLTSQALAMYAVGLIAIAGVQVVQRAFYAFSDNATPLIVGAVTALVHILLNVLLMRLWGVSGIALSTSLTAGITVIALVWLFQRRASHLSLSGLGSYAGRCLALALLCTAPFIWIYASLSFPEGALNYLVGVALSGLAGLTYLLLAWATRIPEGALLWHAGGRFLKRTRE